ncbi:hypothetical protein BKA81DRAFT_344016 [Phyllosticta paracitricarpa]
MQACLSCLLACSLDCLPTRLLAQPAHSVCSTSSSLLPLYFSLSVRNSTSSRFPLRSRLVPLHLVSSRSLSAP